jgi:hypothetical protein
MPARNLIALFVVLSALCVDRTTAVDARVTPDSDADTNTILGLSVTDSDRQFLEQILHTLKKKDMAWIADHMIYPILIDPDRKRQTVNTREEFMTIARRRLSDDVALRLWTTPKNLFLRIGKGSGLAMGFYAFQSSRTMRTVPGSTELPLSAILRGSWIMS